MHRALEQAPFVCRAHAAAAARPGGRGGRHPPARKDTTPPPSQQRWGLSPAALPIPSSSSRQTHRDPPPQGPAASRGAGGAAPPAPGRAPGSRPPAVPPQGAGQGPEPLFQLPQPDHAARVPARGVEGPGGAGNPARGRAAALGPRRSPARQHPGLGRTVAPGGQAAKPPGDRGWAGLRGGTGRWGTPGCCPASSALAGRAMPRRGHGNRRPPARRDVAAVGPHPRAPRSRLRKERGRPGPAPAPLGTAPRHQPPRPGHGPAQAFRGRRDGTGRTPVPPAVAPNVPAESSPGGARGRGTRGWAHKGGLPAPPAARLRRGGRDRGGRGGRPRRQPNGCAGGISSCRRAWAVPPPPRPPRPPLPLSPAARTGGSRGDVDAGDGPDPAPPRRDTRPHGRGSQRRRAPGVPPRPAPRHGSEAPRGGTPRSPRGTAPGGAYLGDDEGLAVLQPAAQREAPGCAPLQLHVHVLGGAGPALGPLHSRYRCCYPPIPARPGPAPHGGGNDTPARPG